ncbi:MAG: toxin-antitoxin system YwqK family antitoxin [Saprospiraceae bacterium]|nr:toxin-antitoxin system YwqK family antitoxin [Lewinella sp.]
MKTQFECFIFAAIVLFLSATSCTDLPQEEGAVVHKAPARLIAQQRFYRSGPLLADFSMTEDSLMHGPYREYDIAGNLLRLMNYKNGSLEGEYLTFFPSGQLASRHEYESGHPNGPQLWYYDNGNIKQEMTIVYGKTEGEVRSYTREGNLQSIRNYDDERQTGSALEYFPSGSIQSFAYYDQDGDRIFYLQYSEEGKVTNVVGYPFANLSAKVNGFNGTFEFSFEPVIPLDADHQFQLLRRAGEKTWICPLQTVNGDLQYEEKLADGFQGAFLLTGKLLLDQDTLNFNEEMYIREGEVLFEH